MLTSKILIRRAWVTTGTLVLAVVALSSTGVRAAAAQSDQRKQVGAEPKETFDVYKLHKQEYIATPEPKLVEVGPANYLTITGRGKPGSDLFKQKMAALYSVAYALKMKNKFSGRDFTVGPLEGLWWGTKGKHDLLEQPKENWNWKLLIRTPRFVKKADVAAVAQRMSRPGADSAMQEIQLETLKEGRCVQLLHVGPYDHEASSMAAMRDFAKAQGLKPSGVHHEIYLSDPNRTPPEKLRTILRQPVK